MTDVALRDYLERLITEVDRRYEQRFAANDAAVAKAERTVANAERAMSSRLDAMNEFRDALKDQANRMATRDEVEKIDQSVRELQRAKANLDGRLMMLSGSISVIVSLILWLLVRLVP